MISSLFFLVFAYLMGSICSAVLISKLFSLPDPRSEGSKNPGATNVLRLAGKKYAAFVLVADLLKGTIPVVLAKLWGADTSLVGFTALAAVVGHMYPLFFNFQGGKGVATAIGALLGFNALVGLMVALTWLLIARVFRYSSLASIISIALAPFYSLFAIGSLDVFPPLFFMTILILIKHKTNISRLIDKTEPKIKLKQNSTVLDSAVFDEVINEEFNIDPEESVVTTNTEKPKTTRKRTSATKPRATAVKSSVKKTKPPTETTKATEKTVPKPTKPKKTTAKKPTTPKTPKTTVKKEAP